MKQSLFNKAVYYAQLLRIKRGIKQLTAKLPKPYRHK